MPVSDTELMHKVQEGSKEAFCTLVRRYQTPLVNFFYRLLWDRAEAEDFAQEVLVKVYKHRDSYSVQSKFSTYLFRIARNHWIDHMRTKGKRRKPLSIDEPGAHTEDMNYADMIDSGAMTAEEIKIREEQLAAAKSAIDALPEEQKMVFLLSEVQGMKYQDIADTLDLPLGTVKSRIHAAVAKLRDLLVQRKIIEG